MIDIVANTTGTLIAVIPLFFYFRKKDEDQIHNILDEWFIVPKNKTDKKKTSKNKKNNKKSKNI